MKTILALVMLLAVLPVASGAVTCRDPDRMFNGRWITLQPLFVWWTNAPEERAYARLTRAEQAALHERPMPAWMHVSGKVVEATLGGWIVEATVTVSPRSNFTQKIYLLHPPEFARREYDATWTKARDARAASAREQRRAAAAHSASSAAVGEANAIERLRQILPGHSAELSPQSRAYSQEAARHQTVANKAGASAAAWEHTAKLNSERAQQFGDLNGNYDLDIFALRTGAKLRGLPVYDVGVRKQHSR